MKTTLIICALNEVKTIANVVKLGQRFVDEIIVIDGHSTDGTPELVRKMRIKIFQDGRKGKGEAVRIGIKNAMGDILVFIDADGSHRPNDIPKLILPIKKNCADLVIASRGKGGSDELSGSINKSIRLIGSSIINLIINLRFKSKISDAQNGFRAIRRDLAISLRLKENIFTIEQEMVIKALKKRYRVLEIASHENERKYGNSRINLYKVALQYLWCLFINIT